MVETFMKKHTLAILPAAIAGLMTVTPNSGFAQTTSSPTQLKKVVVETTREESSENTGDYTVESTTVGTGLNLELRDIPQSVTVVTREIMDDQGMDSVTDALRSANGISVKATDRGRNGLNARGFEVNNYLFDGVPTVSGNVGIETANTAIYDRVEIVRGATGLLSGSGDPSAAVNLVRKRANAASLTGKVSLSLGSWDHRGGMVDVGTPLNSDASVRTRVVVAKNTQDAFIDLENTDNTVFYGIVDADIGDQTQFSIGASDERTKRNGIYWGGLSFYFTDGTRTDWDTSKTTATHWNQWDTEEKTFFATLNHQFDNQWIIKANATHYKQHEYSNLLWVTGIPDKATGEGMEAYPYLYIADPKQTQFDLQATGPFSFLGRDHELTAGIMHSEYEGGWETGGEPVSEIPGVGNFYAWDGRYPAPVWDAPDLGSFETRTQTAAYTAARLQFTDRFTVIAGARLTDWEVEAEEGVWTSAAYTISHDNLITPYLGAIYDVNEQVSAYASYSDIFKPQTSLDRHGEYLDPLSGESYELGLKSELFDGALNASAAVFQIQQDNLATPDEGYFVPGTTNQAFYGAEGTESKGYEFELAGQLSANWDISLGWTKFSAKDANNNDVAIEHPRKLLKLFSKYRFQGNWDGLSLGGGVNWQSEEPRKATNPATDREEKIGQPSYTLANLMMEYAFNQQLSLQLNVNNLFDEKYYESSWGTFTYGEPRNTKLTLDYRF